MSERRPTRRDPQRVTPVALHPPMSRSRAALAFSAYAAEGRFCLQVCASCGTTLYPPRDACPKCLGVDLPWRDIDGRGTLIATTTIRATPSRYFRAHLPWRIGTVALEAGPSLITYLSPACRPEAPVVVATHLDRSGRGVLVAKPPGAPAMDDDPALRELSCSPKFRRILITDGRHPASVPLARALVDAGAASVSVGFPPGARFAAERAAYADTPATIVPLDVTDTSSVEELAAGIAHKVDILIATPHHIRPGSILSAGGLVAASEAIDVNYLGLLRLARSFGPTMRARGGDGVDNAVAWVNLLSAYARATDPAYGLSHASHAAAVSLAQALRADLRRGGVRVLNVFCGPLEDAWHQSVPPPKTMPAQIVAAILDGLHGGWEEAQAGDVAKDLATRWRRDPKVLELELGGASDE